MICNKPTVGEFIEFLRKNFDMNAPLRILDPDTEWTISKIHALNDHDTHPGAVYLTGEYHEMTKEYE